MADRMLSFRPPGFRGVLSRVLRALDVIRSSFAPRKDPGPMKLNRDDVHRKYYRGSGKGGQNRNKVETGCRLVHEPTGLKVEICVERTRAANEEIAWEVLQEKLDGLEETRRLETMKRAHEAKPEAAFGSQVRSYILAGKNQRVVDHRTGVSCGNPRSVLDGELDVFLRGK